MTPDSSGNGLDATILGTSATGRFGNAVAFSAANANGAVVAHPGAVLAPQHGAVAVASSAKIHITNGCWVGLEKDNEPSARNSPSDDRVFTGGPNCRDYQRFYEGKGWTVKQSDANANPYDSGGGIPWIPFP